MATWYKNDARNEKAFWLGHFADAADLKRYAIGRFRKELGLPDTKYFEIVSLQYAFSGHGASDAVGRLRWSHSFLDEVMRKARRMKLLKANGVIAVRCHFSDDASALDGSRAAFLGYVSYDSDAGQVVDDAPEYLNDEKVSIWAGHFTTKAKFEKYFSLDDQTRRTPNKFATDFKIPEYETDFASWVTARGMKPQPISDLLKDFPLTTAFRKKIAAKAAERGLTEATAIYMASDVDYDKIGKSSAGEKRCKGVLRYIGSFDSPSLESEMRIVRRRAMKKDSPKRGKRTTPKSK